MTDDDQHPADVGRAGRFGTAGLTAWVGRTWARPGTQHLIAAINRYNDRLGTQFAGSMTYFSFLALVPILMVAFAVAGFVLASRPHLLVTLRSDVAAQLPAGLSTTVNGILDTAVNARLTVGTLGLAIALYSGISWMGNLRAAIQAMWRPDFDSNNEIRAENLLQYYWKSLQYLIFLGLAILVSLGLTTAGSTAQTLLLRWLGLGNISWLHPVFTVLPIVLPLLLTSTTAKLFGQVIGLLFFFNFVATVVLLVAAWIATTPGEPPLPNRPTPILSTGSAAQRRRTHPDGPGAWMQRSPLRRWPPGHGRHPDLDCAARSRSAGRREYRAEDHPPPMTRRVEFDGGRRQHLSVSVACSAG